MFNTTLDKMMEDRCLKPVLQNQAVAANYLLDEDWTAADGDIFPGTVMYLMDDGIHVGRATSTGEQTPLGLSADYYAPAYGVTDMTTGNIAVWTMNKGALFTLAAPAISDGMATAKPGDLLKADTTGLLTPLASGDSETLAVVRLQSIQDTEHITIMGI